MLPRSALASTRPWLLLACVRACVQPLTPMLHLSNLSDMRGAISGYTEGLARTLQALALSLGDLEAFYWGLPQSAAAAPTAAAAAAVPHSASGRNALVANNVPYMLHGRCAAFGICSCSRTAEYQGGQAARG